MIHYKCLSARSIFALAVVSMPTDLAMPSLRKVHWTVPSVIILGLLCGSLLSLGHHLFYHHLAGTVAPTGEYAVVGTSISRQKLNIAIGNAIAFAVKSMLTLAVGMAYGQVFWKSFKTTKEGQDLSTLDTKFSVLTNALSLAKLSVWVRYPLLFLLACIAWYVLNRQCLKVSNT